MKTLGILTISCAALMLAGCDYNQKKDAAQPSMGVLNSTCPLSGRSVNGGPVEDYDGSKIGLCCSGCVYGWNEMSTQDKNAYVASVTK